MTDFFDKLNTLLRASVNTVLNSVTNPVTNSDPTRASHLSGNASLKDMDREIIGLRKQIDLALAEEESLVAKLAKLNDQVAAYDQQADAALGRGEEETARELVQKMQQQRRTAAMVKSQLDQHRELTYQFIERVNILESMVADARRQQGLAPRDEADPAGSAATGLPDFSQLSQLGKEAGTALSEVVRNLRERAEHALTPAPADPRAVEPKPLEPQTNEPRALEPEPIEPEPIKPLSAFTKPDVADPVQPSPQAEPVSSNRQSTVPPVPDLSHLSREATAKINEAALAFSETVKSLRERAEQVLAPISSSANTVPASPADHVDNPVSPVAASSDAVPPTAEVGTPIKVKLVEPTDESAPIATPDLTVAPTADTPDRPVAIRVNVNPTPTDAGSGAGSNPSPQADSAPTKSAEELAIEADLARRRARLSKLD